MWFQLDVLWIHHKLRHSAIIHGMIQNLQGKTELWLDPHLLNFLQYLRTLPRKSCPNQYRKSKMLTRLWAPHLSRPSIVGTVQSWSLCHFPIYIVSHLDSWPDKINEETMSVRSLDSNSSASPSQPHLSNTMWVQYHPLSQRRHLTTLDRCLLCRQRKQKCNRQLPKCGNCTKGKFDCQYVAGQKKRGLGAGYVSELEERIGT